MEQKVKIAVSSLNDYFGIENKNMALWFYGSLGFPIICGMVVLLVSALWLLKGGEKQLKLTKKNVQKLIEDYWNTDMSAVELDELIDDLKEVSSLNTNQRQLLKDIELTWSQRKHLTLSCKTSAVVEVLNTNYHAVYGNEIDEVVNVFLNKEEKKTNKDSHPS